MPQSSIFHSFDATPFLLQKWSNCDASETVIIGGHGFCGASYDFSGFASQVLSEVPNTTIYATNLRGMGLDPVEGRRGDIENSDYWLRDLHELTKQVRARHPDSRIIWCSESLGAMIATHAYSSAPSELHKCDALALLSPVVEIGNQVPRWKIGVAKAIAKLAPSFRLKLDFFTGQQQVQVTQGADDHTEQSATNDWHVDSFTLRQLSAIGSLIEGMKDEAKHLDYPVLVLNGGNDYFTPAEAIDNWLPNIPNSAELTHQHFPDAYHLMLYDAQASEIFTAVSDWIKSLK